MIRALERSQAEPALYHSAIYIGAALLNAAVPFLVMPILTRALGPTDYGIVGTFTALSAVAAALLGLSTQGQIGVKYFADGGRDFSSAISACLATLAGTLAIAVPTVFLAAPTLFRVSQIPPNWQWTIVAAGAGQFLIALVLAVWQIRGEVLKFAVLQVGTTMANIGLTILLVLGFAWGWQGRALASVAATVGAGLVGSIMLWRRGDFGPLRSANMRSALRFGGALVPHVLAGLAMASVDRVVVLSIAGTKAAGLYFAASQLCSIISIVALAANQTWMPWFYRQLSEGTHAARMRVVRLTWFLLGAIGFLTVLFVFMSPWLIALLAGDQYKGAQHFIPFLAAAAACQAAYYLFANYIFFVQRTEMLSAVTLLMSLIQLILTVVLVQRLGAIGAAISAAIAQATYLALIFLLSYRLRPMPWLGRP